MQQHTISFDYQATYHTLGSTEADQLWLVLHGYRQLSRYFIRKFAFLEEDALIVAPEGLSNFYIQGVGGRVGASWMTSHQRDISIRNYIAYLSEVYHGVTSGRRRPFRQVNVLGFSQGVTTLLRWLVHARPAFDRLVMCAGGFPADIDKEICREIFRNKPCYYVYGDEDEFIREGSIEKLASAFEEYGLDVTFSRFTGQHEIHQPSLEAIAKKSR
jgi:predicted esterase